MSHSQDLREFRRLKRRWFVDSAVTLLAIVMFGISYFSHAHVKTLVFWSVILLWQNYEADRAYDQMMRIGEKYGDG